MACCQSRHVQCGHGGLAGSSDVKGISAVNSIPINQSAVALSRIIWSLLCHLHVESKATFTLAWLLVYMVIVGPALYILRRKL